MIKLLLLIGVGIIVYKLFWNKNYITPNRNNENNDDNELIECSICHTFVPKNECTFTINGCICKECR